MNQGFPRRFGPYVLARPLARGGMGALYLALHGERGMEKLCVVKTALPHLADRGYLQRFRDEAKVVVRLSHGNLVTVFDAGQVKGEIYLAMDFVEGKDLRAVWNRCAQKGIAFPVPVAVHIVKEMLRGLAYAHSFESLSLVHRDVSPPNVLLSYSGEVKLTDFGLATSTLKLEKTAPGVIYGKVSYMAPEQARGDALDGRTDLYAAGVILWELLTGRQLFPPGGGPAAPAPGTDDDMLEKVRRPEITPPSKRAARVPAELDAIVMRALALDPKDRYQSGEAFRSDLAAFLAKAAPSTDGEQVARFLRDLFGAEIAKERTLRSDMIAAAAKLLPSPITREGQRAFHDAATPPPPTPRDATKAIGSLPSPVPVPPAVPPPEEETTQTLKPGADEPSRMVGTVLAGRYRIRRLCGEGGMGRVYEAEHIEIGKRVAVKVLHPAYTRSPEVVERFRREARAASKIGHPNIVNVTDSGTTDDNSFFFVMEFIEGIELGLAIHREGPLPVGRTLRIAEQMCEALQAAHDAGVIHRDLKPENVLLIAQEGKHEFVKVLDFGIAKSAEIEESAKSGVSGAGRRLTRPGVAMGTPEYMAPEQAAGKGADARSDIYAVGSILYEMLTGSPPYDGDNVMEVLHKKANEAPKRLSQVRPDIPPEVAELVERAMARQPSERPQSMGVLAQALREMRIALEGTPEGRPPSLPGLPARPVTMIGGFDPAPAFAAMGLSKRTMAVSAAVLVAIGGFVIVRAASPPPRPAAQVVAPVPAPVPPRAPAPAPAAAEPTPVAAEPVVDTPPPVEVLPPPRAPRANPAASAAAVASRQLLAEGETLFKAQRYGDARDAFSKALPTAKGRDRGRILIGLANIFFQEKNYKDAAKHARESAKAGGGAEAQLVLADALFKLENWQEARKAYAEALKRAGSGNEAARRRAERGLESIERRVR